MNNIIETRDLSFSYPGAQGVLDGLNLALPKGSIYGYLGKNGAGKTTTINLILKLLPLKNGNIFYNGRDIMPYGNEYFQKVGSLLQPSAMYKHMTPKEQLRYLSFFYDVDSHNIDKVLVDVGLYEYRNKCIKRLSTGLKQRLAIAMALLHEPEILILDEPTNGLNPNSVIDFRLLISRLNESGITILMSSHIIGELEKICSHIGILDNGKLICQDSMANLQKESGMALVIRCSDTLKALKLLDINSLIEEGDNESGFKCQIYGDDDYARIIKQLSDNDIDIYNIERERFNLESYYLKLTN